MSRAPAQALTKAPGRITPAGETMGLYIDANRRTHGFLLLP